MEVNKQNQEIYREYDVKMGMGITREFIENEFKRERGMKFVISENLDIFLGSSSRLHFNIEKDNGLDRAVAHGMFRPWSKPLRLYGLGKVVDFVRSAGSKKIDESKVQEHLNDFFRSLELKI